jgi:hypothetical protein
MQQQVEKDREQAENQRQHDQEQAETHRQQAEKDREQAEAKWERDRERAEKERKEFNRQLAGISDRCIPPSTPVPRPRRRSLNPSETVSCLGRTAKATLFRYGCIPRWLQAGESY